MPLYSHECNHCKTVHDFFRPMSRAADRERCPACGHETERLYSSTVPKEFAPYHDEKFGCEVTSIRHEEKLMRKHGQVYTRDAMSGWKNQGMMKEMIHKKQWEKSRGLI